MKFKEVYEYNAPLDQVWKMLSDPAFVVARDENLQIPDPHVTTTATGHQIVSLTSGDVPASMIPDAAKRFLKGGTSFEIREEWRRVDATHAEGVMQAQGKGVPAHVNAKVVLTETPQRTTEAVMVGQIKISIPFLGPKLERQALSFAPQLIQADNAAATAWLAAHH